MASAPYPAVFHDSALLLSLWSFCNNTFLPLAPLLGKLGCLWDSDAFPRCVVHGAARVLHAAAMRWSRLLWLRLWLAALLVWVRCRADGEEEQRHHQAARLAAGTGDGGGHSSTPLSQCTYTFILPEMMTTGATQLPSCPGRGEPTPGGNSLLGEAAEETHGPVVGQRVQHLELAIENYTHWIQQVSGLAVGKGV